LGGTTDNSATGGYVCAEWGENSFRPQKSNDHRRVVPEQRPIERRGIDNGLLNKSNVQQKFTPKKNEKWASTENGTCAPMPGEKGGKKPK